MPSNTLKPRSPTLNLIFDRFVEALKIDAAIGGEIANKVKALIDSGDTLKPESLEEAIFPG